MELKEPQQLNRSDRAAAAGGRAPLTLVDVLHTGASSINNDIRLLRVSTDRQFPSICISVGTEKVGLLYPTYEPKMTCLSPVFQNKVPWGQVEGMERLCLNC